MRRISPCNKRRAHLLLSIVVASLMVFGLSACETLSGGGKGDVGETKAQLTAEQSAAQKAKAEAAAEKERLEQMEAEKKAEAKAAAAAEKARLKEEKAAKKAAEKAAEEKAEAEAAAEKARVKAEKAAKKAAEKAAEEKAEAEAAAEKARVKAEKAAKKAAEKAAEEKAEAAAAAEKARLKAEKAAKKAAEKAAEEKAEAAAAAEKARLKEEEAAKKAALKAAEEKAKAEAAAEKARLEKEEAAKKAAAKAAEEKAKAEAAAEKARLEKEEAAKKAAAKAAEEKAKAEAAAEKARLEKEEAAKKAAAKAAEEKAKAEAAAEKARLEKEEAAKKAAAKAAEEKAKAELKKKNAEYNAAVAAYKDGELQQALTMFTALSESKVSLGQKKDAAVAQYLSETTTRLQTLNATRAATAAYVKEADSLLNEGKWEAAKEYLERALPQQKLLSADERIKMANLMAQAQEAERVAVEKVVAAQKRETLAKDALSRADEILQEEIRLRKVLAEQNMAAADELVGVAKADYANLNYESALKNIEDALKYVPDHEDALALRVEIRAITGSEKEPVEWLRAITSEAFKVRLEMAHDEMYDAMKRGKNAFDREDYTESVKQLTDASELIEYLRPHVDVRSVEGQITAMLANAKREKAIAEEKLAAAREYEAMMAAQDEARLQIERNEQALVQLYRDAAKEFERGKYDSAVGLIEQLLASDPENIPAKELLESTRDAMKRRQWDTLYAAKDQAIEDERLILAEKLIFPAHTISYPAKEVWDEIVQRDSIMEGPSAEVRLSEREQELERLLDLTIPSFSFEETPLQDVVGYFRLQPEFEEVNFVIDENRLLDREVFITRTLSNVTLRQALRMMLQPSGLNFVISNDSIFISTSEGCIEEESRGENMYFWQYDVRDLLVDLEGGGSGGNDSDSGNGSSGNSSSSNSSSSNNDDDDDSGGTDSDLVQLLQLFTGPQNWDVAGAFESSSDDGNDNGGDDSGGMFGGTSGGFGGGSGEGGDAFGGIGGGLMGTREGAGRLMVLRNGYLMVNHVDRLHTMIQKFLTDLRAQITIQVLIEGRYITYTDQFYKDVGIDWDSAVDDASAFVFNASGRGFIPGTQVNISPFSPEANVSSTDLSTAGGFVATVNFMNSNQTQAVISAVKNSQNATTVAAPHVIVMDTEEQELDLELTGHYISGYEVDDTGGFALPIIEPYTVSTTNLTVTPVVSADRRYVTMNISLDVSQGVATAIAGGAVIPVLVEDTGDDEGSTSSSVRVDISTVDETSNSIESLVRVPDRGTVVLGGLSSVEESEGQKSIPLLCHIPILKRLVTKDAVSKNRAHNVFMVTPTVLIQDEVEP